MQLNMQRCPGAIDDSVFGPGWLTPSLQCAVEDASYEGAAFMTPPGNFARTADRAKGNTASFPGA